MTTPLLSRADAGLRPPKGRQAADFDDLTLHYGGLTPWPSSADRSSPAAFRDSTDHNRCASVWRAWQAFHMDDRGWLDIAYNSGVCPHGVRYDGRGPGIKNGANGTTTGNAKSGTVVYLAGGDDPLTDEARQAYLDERDRYGLPLRWPHHHWHSTACPGDHVDDWIGAGFPAPGAVAPPSSPPVLPPTAGAPPYPGLVRRGNRGPVVAAIQLRLIYQGHGGHIPDGDRDGRYGADPGGRGLDVDGDFGAITERHVKWYQRANGLTPDGIVGPRTWARLWVG